ncbi:hypothetical protein JCM1841_001574 [Sporobolomyces salmonicolor]
MVPLDGPVTVARLPSTDTTSTPTAGSPTLHTDQHQLIDRIQGANAAADALDDALKSPGGNGGNGGNNGNNGNSGAHDHASSPRSSVLLPPLSTDSTPRSASTSAPLDHLCDPSDTTRSPSLGTGSPTSTSDTPPETTSQPFPRADLPTSNYTHLPIPPNAIPADVLDTAAQAQTSAEPLYPSPSSTFRPPPETEGGDLSKRLDDRIAREKDKSTNPAASATARDAAMSSDISTQVPAASTEDATPASPQVPPRPPSRPPSRPTSLSRPPSSYRLRSSSSVSRLSTASGRAPSERRLSTSTTSGLPSPRIPEDSSSSCDPWAVRLPTSPLVPSSRRCSTLSASKAVVVPATAPWEVPVIVRDFAFPRDDPRFEGRPHPSELEGGSGGFRSFRGYDGDDNDEGKRGERDSLASSSGSGAGFGEGRSGFSWGFVTSHTSDFPASDFDEEGPDAYGFHDADDHELEDDDAGLGEFVPGLYSAVYDFEPELETEMRIEAGEMVSVFERQCAGWVQAGRIVDNAFSGEVGLVPENYLALVEADPAYDISGEAQGQVQAQDLDTPGKTLPTRREEPAEQTTEPEEISLR